MFIQGYYVDYEEMSKKINAKIPIIKDNVPSN